MQELAAIKEWFRKWDFESEQSNHENQNRCRWRASTEMCQDLRRRVQEISSKSKVKHKKEIKSELAEVFYVFMDEKVLL